jgi:hypothetical protein
MEPAVHLPALLAALMFCAMLAGFVEGIAAGRKHRDDDRRFKQRMRRNHGRQR